jgi:SAM-dependent MidA family methyltransferase
MATSQRRLTPLAAILRDEIRSRGPVSFREFMSRCLYDQAHGFYATGGDRIGRGGDFFTSVSVGPVFGELLAEHAARTWERVGRPPSFSLIEAGAHDGRLAADILTALSRNSPALFDCVRVQIIEAVPSLHAAQAANLERWRGKVRWIDPAGGAGFQLAAPAAPQIENQSVFVEDKLEACPTRGGANLSSANDKRETYPTGQCVIANELLDAFPVERVRFDGFAWRRLMVAVDSNGEFTWLAEKINDTALDAFARSLGGEFPAGYTTEFCPGISGWCASIAALLSNGALVVIDYGREAADYHAPHRMEGTLRGYHRHRRLDDPFAAPGETDLTADVNFTHLREAARSAGLIPISTKSQEQFLTGLAAARFAGTGTAADSPIDSKWLRQFQTLTHPGLMGAAFHVLEFQKPTG